MKDREMLAAVTAAYDKKKANRPYRRPAPMNQGSSSASFGRSSRRLHRIITDRLRFLQKSRKKMSTTGF
jgi:hypothetical protein